MASTASDPAPLIGVTTYLEQAQTGVWDVPASFLPKVYLDAVTDAGGIALLLPPQPSSPEVAAAVMLQGITAHYLVNSTYAVQPGDLVLAHAVAGGVGQLLVQLVKAKGATLIGDGPTVLTKVRGIGNDFALDEGIGVCGKGGQGVPAGVGQPTLLVEGLTVGGTAA